MSDIRLHRLTAQEVESVSALARIIWQATYPTLISQVQIDTMLDDRYAAERIRPQLDDPAHGWWAAYDQHALVGFAHAMLNDQACKLDKLYVHPTAQRRGIGGMLMGAIQQWARQQQTQRLWLQVNRGNTQAITAYQKYGFRITESCIFDIGNGFVMDDYIMEYMQ